MQERNTAATTEKPGQPLTSTGQSFDQINFQIGFANLVWTIEKSTMTENLRSSENVDIAPFSNKQTGSADAPKHGC